MPSRCQREQKFLLLINKTFQNEVLICLWFSLHKWAIFTWFNHQSSEKRNSSERSTRPFLLMVKTSGIHCWRLSSKDRNPVLEWLEVWSLIDQERWNFSSWRNRGISQNNYRRDLEVWSIRWSHCLKLKFWSFSLHFSLDLGNWVKEL